MITLGSIAALSSPYLLKLIIDDAIGQQDYGLLLTLLTIILGILLLRIVFGYFADYLYTWISNKMMRKLIQDIFTHTLQLPIQYFKENKVGNVVYLINTEVSLIRKAFTSTLVNLVNNFFAIIILIIMMWVLSGELLLLVIALYPIFALIAQYFAPKLRSIVSQTRVVESDLLAFLTERFSNIKFIKLFDAYDAENRSLTNSIDDVLQLNLKSTMLSSLSRNLSTLILASIPLIVLFYGGKKVIEATLSLGTLVAFIQYVNRLNTPVSGLISTHAEIIRTSVSIERLFDLLDLKIQSNDKEPLKFNEAIHTISFDAVSFQIGDKKILNQCSFEFKAGNHYALVGPSGSGKSTIIDLLTKITSPTTGHILINGTPIDQISRVYLTNRIAVCSQDYFILEGTVLDNLVYPLGNEPDESEVLRIAMLLQLHEKLHQNVGEKGVNLSGGQKHKVAIGRAILRQPEILILDETTSEIDAKSEHDIFQYLLKETDIKMIIAITHRATSLRLFDQLFFLEEGEIMEQSNYQEMIVSSSNFQELFKLDSQAFYYEKST